MTHVKNNTGNQEWYTPDYILQKARIVLGDFDLDPASNPIAQQKVMGNRYYSSSNSGLSEDIPWHGRVWVNPPYTSNLIKQFCSKLNLQVKAGSVTSFITLTNNATETKWFSDLFEVSSAFCFTKSRIKFLDEQFRQGKQPLQGQVLCYLGIILKCSRSNFQTLEMC